MALAGLDWAIIAGLLALTLLIGIWASRRASADSASYFLGSRHMPWWLLGMSMVATTFSTDTPNLVTDIVRTQGVAGNWTWWCFLLTGMLTTFVYARLWRRLGVTTDIEFYERRYEGRAAAFLRGFRAVYLGVVFNMMAMGLVTLAAIKIGGVLMGLSPVEVVLVAGLVTVVFSAAGGFLGVLITDLILFFTAMVGSVLAAWYALDHPQVGGLGNLLTHEAVQAKSAIFPDFTDAASYVPLLLVPLAVQWWAAWYPGSEPGGGGYVAQRMLAAKDERHAIAAVAFFNFAHYALRPWPWIVVALASLIVYPDLASLSAALPQVDPGIIGHDLAYPAMLTLMPAGVLGLVLASLISAYISTISTHLNWGASYVVNDVFVRFIKPDASARQQVFAGRISTIVLMVLAALMALALENAFQAFQLLLTVGAGTGLLFILRWFWSRINAWSEIAAMGFSFTVALLMEFIDPEAVQGWARFVASVGITTVGWVAVTLLTPPTSTEKLERFRNSLTVEGSDLVFEARRGIVTAILAAFAIYGLLFAIGGLVYGQTVSAAIWAAISLFCGTFSWRHYKRTAAGKLTIEPAKT